jgi:hypothetical protein
LTNARFIEVEILVVFCKTIAYTNLNKSYESISNLNSNKIKSSIYANSALLNYFEFNKINVEELTKGCKKVIRNDNKVDLIGLCIGGVGFVAATFGAVYLLNELLKDL